MSILPVPTQSEVERAFFDAMMAAGFSPPGIEADTTDFVRFDAPGDKKHKQNGFYKLRTGRYPVGWFGDWKIGQQIQWQWDFGRELTTKERQSIKDEHRRLKAEAEVAKESRQREVAEEASKIWQAASTDAEGHDYLTKKRIAHPRGLRIHTGRDGTKLLTVPMWAFDLAGHPMLQSLQMIAPDGTKRFLKAGRMQGCFFSIKGDNSLIVACEGVATGFKIWEATGASVVCAFNAGNLLEVVKEVARHRPLSTIMIAGDDDQIQPDDWDEKGGGKAWVNTGAKKAEAAAKAVGCRWVLPVFADGPARNRTDYDDLARCEGVEMVARQILGAIKTVDPQMDQPSAEIVQIDRGQDESWRAELPRTSTGMTDAANVHGVAIYIQNHRLLRGRLAYNEFSQTVELDSNELADHNVAEFRRLMHADRFKAKKSDVVDEMFAEARRNSHDPLAQYLKGLVWDGRVRLDTWCEYYLGSENTPYAQMIGRKFLIGAVARALKPGVKNDVAIVLEGPQGRGKSTAARYLFGDRFFVDHLPDFHSKDSFQQLQGRWCVEIAELAAMGKAEVQDVKQFLSRLTDVYRPPYGKLPIEVPRRCVFFGTINPEEGGYLKDTTGARRFWPIEVSISGPMRLGAILRDRDQLWAEAVEAYQNGEAFHLATDEEEALAKVEQEKRREIDPWEELLRDHIHLSSTAEMTIETALAAVKVTPDKMNAILRRRMGAVLRALGWVAGTARVDGKPSRVFVSPASAAMDAKIDKSAISSAGWLPPEWE